MAKFGDQMTDASKRSAIRAEVDDLVPRLAAVCDGHEVLALISALTEQYARILSASIHDAAEMEKALTMFVGHARCWWLADRGGSFRVS